MHRSLFHRGSLGLSFSEFIEAGDFSFYNYPKYSDKGSLLVLGVSTISETTFQTLGQVPAAFHLALGDLGYTPNEQTFCDLVTNKVAFPVQLVTGNHEEDNADGGHISNYVGCLPDRMSSTGVYGVQYYFDHGDMRVILVSPLMTASGKYYETYGPGTVERAWLDSAIDQGRSLGKRWIIVGYHIPCVTAEWTITCVEGMEGFEQHLIEKEVDLLLRGHAHVYERGKQLTCIERGNYRSSCVADDGFDNTYTKGSGTIPMTIGAFGQSMRRINHSDVDVNWFASTMGAHSQRASYGFVKFLLYSDRMEVGYVPTVKVRNTFSDSFVIQSESTPQPPAAAPPPQETSTFVIDEWYLVVGGPDVGNKFKIYRFSDDELSAYGAIRTLEGAKVRRAWQLLSNLGPLNSEQPDTPPPEPQPDPEPEPMLEPENPNPDPVPSTWYQFSDSGDGRCTISNSSGRSSSREKCIVNGETVIGSGSSWYKATQNADGSWRISRSPDTGGSATVGGLFVNGMLQ